MGWLAATAGLVVMAWLAYWRRLYGITSMALFAAAALLICSMVRLLVVRG